VTIQIVVVSDPGSFGKFGDKLWQCRISDMRWNRLS